MLATASTHLATAQLSLADRFFTAGDSGQVARLASSLSKGVNLVVGGEAGEGKVSGVNDEVFSRLLALAEDKNLPLLVEADGARMCPLKAPAEHEPNIPTAGDRGADWLEAVVVVAGLRGLGKPLSPEWVHRPEIFAALCGLELGQAITPEALARVLSHPQGGLKNIPPGARRVALLNQADTGDLQALGQTLARMLLPSFRAILIAALEPSSGLTEAVTGRERTSGRSQQAQEPAVFAACEPVAGIVLAAGESSRLGQAKQLLPWKGEPLIRHIVRTALSADLSQVVVVTGAYADQVERSLEGMAVTITRNRHWKIGQSSSVKAGLRATDKGTGAAIFILADQPHVTPDLIRALVEAEAATLSPIVAPLVDGQRGNPVLFSRDTFPAFEELEGDMGGRKLTSRYPVQWVPWHDREVLLDIDTAQDYRRLVKRG